MSKRKLTDKQVLKYIVSLLNTFPLNEDEPISGCDAVDALVQIKELIDENK